MTERTANISHDSFHNYTGTPIPCDYRFVCWVGDVNEKELLSDVMREGREIIQVVFPGED